MFVEEKNLEVITALQSGRYAFLDAGCGDGGSIDQLTRRFGRAPGLGLDCKMEMIEASRAAGFDAILCNLLASDLQLPEDCVEFAAAFDVLEHLPCESEAIAVLEKLGRTARDFLVIRHPSFEDIDYLAGLGLKLNWTDWTGHPNMMKLEDYRRIFREFGWENYKILPHMLYPDSHHNSVVPLNAPTDTVKYDAALHGPKPLVKFDKTVWGKFDIFVKLNPTLDQKRWQDVARVDGWEAQWDI